MGRIPVATSLFSSSSSLVVVSAGSSLFAGTDGGSALYVTTNNGTNWTQANSGLDAPRVFSLASGGTWAPQLVHVLGPSALPQFEQNLAPAGLAVPHFGHVTVAGASAVASGCAAAASGGCTPPSATAARPKTSPAPTAPGWPRP